MIKAGEKVQLKCDVKSINNDYKTPSIESYMWFEAGNEKKPLNKKKIYEFTPKNGRYRCRVTFKRSWIQCWFRLPQKVSSSFIIKIEGEHRYNDYHTNIQ